MHAVVSEKKKELAEVCRQYDVECLEVFGSAAKEGTDFDPETSDFDFLVKFKPSDGRATLKQYFDFSRALRQILGYPVDLIELGVIRNPYLRMHIDKSREIVYASSR